MLTAGTWTKDAADFSPQIMCVSSRENWIGMNLAQCVASRQIAVNWIGVNLAQQTCAKLNEVNAEATKHWTMLAD